MPDVNRRRSPRRRTLVCRRGLAVALAALTALAGAVVLPAAATTAPTSTRVAGSWAGEVPDTLPGTSGRLRVSTTSAPRTTVVRDDRGVVATFTPGARTVTVRGPQRTFAESTTTATVTTTAWVRILPVPATTRVDWTWLAAALADRSPDVLAVAAQYTTGAPVSHDESGARLAGDASYGPLVGTSRQEGADFNDYLGVPWTYPTGADWPEPEQIGSLDCSGYVRMVLGRRSGVPLGLAPDGRSLPRRSFEMLGSAPGVVLQADTGSRPAIPKALSAGDLVFFDASADDGTRVDHVGIYLGVDSAGAPRFLSSRKTVDGPTMGDVGGRSTLSGTGLYATSFRAVRRV